MALHIHFDVREFVLAHGRAPKGRRSWAFEIVGREGVLLSPASTYGQAKKWLRRWLVRRKVTGTVRVVVCS